MQKSSSSRIRLLFGRLTRPLIVIFLVFGALSFGSPPPQVTKAPPAPPTAEAPAPQTTPAPTPQEAPPPTQAAETTYDTPAVTPPRPPKESNDVDIGVTVGSGTSSSPSKTASASNSQTAATNKVDPQNITVYITKSGSKYHCAGCRYLRTSSIPISLKDAVVKYSPCSVCSPPTIDKADSQQGANTPPASTANAVRSGTPTGDTTATGLPIYVGPRGGRYHISKNGNKVYEKN